MNDASRPRVVVTGLGTINAAAQNTDEFVGALSKGISGIGPVRLFDTSQYRSRIAAEVTRIPTLKSAFEDYSGKRMSRADRMAFAALLEALRDAGLAPLPRELARDAGVFIGGGAGGLPEAEPFYRDYLRNGARHAAFSVLAPLYCASTADHIATKLRLFGPKLAFMTACSSGANAVASAANILRNGSARIMIAGGTEPLSRVTFATFNALKALDTRPCRPFDRNRGGLTLGEGAGILILEQLEHALGRGARIHAEFLGYGISCDGYHMTAPDPEGGGAAAAMSRALEDAWIRPDQVEYINAHGTGTPANDLMETRAVKRVFGKQAYDIPVSSTKGVTGHTLGAAGALEAVASVLCIAREIIPPTLNHEDPDPECDLDYVPGKARKGRPNVVLSNSFAFGGNNTSLLFGRYESHG